MDDEKYMLRKSTKGYLVKLEPEAFYRLLDYSLTVCHRKGRPIIVSAWQRGVSWRDAPPINVSHFVLKVKRSQIIDHRNRDVLDNRKCNLRTVTKRQNNLNGKKRGKNTLFYGVFPSLNEKRQNRRFRAYFCRQRYRKTINFGFSVLGLFLAAVAHDKMVIENNDEDYAPLNFQMFKIPKFKKVLLGTDIKLLRSIYLGQKNKNSKETIEKTRPEKKNTIYKNQFFFDFGR
jgi:hypothetical protein